MKEIIKIIIIEHEPDDVEFLHRELKKGGIDYIAEVVETEKDFEQALLQFQPDIILSDYSLPGYSGLTAFHYVEKKAPTIPFIFVSGTIGEENVVELIKKGVTDYVLKDKLFTLIPKFNRALKEAKEHAEKIIAERELKISERRLAEAQAIAHIGNWELDYVTNEVERSDEACRILGFSPNEIKPSLDAFLACIHPEDLDKVKSTIAYSENTLTNINFYCRIILKNKTIRYVYCDCKVSLDNNKKPIRLFGIIHDITEKIEAEKELIKNEKLFRALSENSSDGKLMINEKCEIIFQSVSVKRILGYEFDENIGKSVYDIIQPDDCKAMKRLCAQLATEPSVIKHFQCRMIHKDGHFIYAEGTLINLLHDNNVNAIISNFRDITERKKATEKIQHTEENLRQIINLVPYSIFAKDIDGNYLFVNKVFAELYGPTVDSMLNKNILEAVPSKYEGEVFLKQDREVIESGRMKILPEVTFTDTNGKLRYFHTTKIPYRIRGIDKPAVLGIAIDITENKKAAAALRQNEKFLEKAQEVGHIGHWVWEINQPTNCVIWSRETYHIFGCHEKGFDGEVETFFSLVHPDDLENVKNAITDSVANQKKYHIEHRIVRPDGEIRWVQEQADVTYDAAKTPMQMIGVCRDITEEKVADEKLKASEMRFKMLIENNYDAIILTDDKSYPLYQSPSTDRMLGWTLEERKNNKRFKFAHPDDAEKMKTYFRHAVKNPGVSAATSFRMNHKNGNFIWVESTITNMLGNEYVKAMVINFRDITEKKNAEEKMLNINEELEGKVINRTHELEKSNKELETFTYSVSHDLRAPLRAIDGFSRMLEDHCADTIDDEARRYLSIIKTSANRMGNLIDDLLNLSRLGRLDVQQTNIDHNKLVANVVSDLEKTETHNAELKINELPPVKGDKSMLEQVWVNLISNAVKYSSKKTQPQIEIGANQNTHETVYFIKDNGAGFDMKYVDKLFGVFHRLHKPTDFEGTGVGLAIVKLILEKHGGRIWVDSKLNEGTTFYFSLPK